MTVTARYGFPQINPATDNVDVVNDFNVPYAAIDLLLGSQVCTSATRPSAPVSGQLIYETDTGMVRKRTSSAAWQTVGNSVSTSGSLPANPIQGDLVYLSDILAVAYYSGGAWHTTGLIVCTSGTRPSGGSLQNGSFIYETDTKRILVYNGSSWDNKAYSNYVCTSGTHPASPFTGLEIYETDTGLNAVYNGSSYLYGAQQIASTQVVGSTTTAVTFNSIPAVARLLVTWRARTIAAAADMRIKLDNDGSSGHYTWYKNSGRGAAMTVSGSSSDSGASIGVAAGTTTANFYSSGFIVIDGWSTTTGYATYSGVSTGLDSATSYWIEQYGGLYNAAVGPHNRLDLYIISSGSLAAGSQFSVYALP